MSEVRCPSKLHAIVTDSGLVEISCNSRFCGAGAGVTILHRFDPTSGDLVETLSFKDPRKDRDYGTRRNPASVRTP